MQTQNPAAWYPLVTSLFVWCLPPQSRSSSPSQRRSLLHWPQLQPRFRQSNHIGIADQGYIATACQAFTRSFHVASWWEGKSTPSLTAPAHVFTLNGVLSSPLPGCGLVSGSVSLVDMGNLGDQRVVRVRIRQHRADGQKNCYMCQY